MNGFRRGILTETQDYALFLFMWDNFLNHFKMSYEGETNSNSQT